MLVRFFGRWIESSPPIQGMMGATLEIQRTQRIEALEQQMIRQQVWPRPTKIWFEKWINIILGPFFFFFFRPDRQRVGIVDLRSVKVLQSVWLTMLEWLEVAAAADPGQESGEFGERFQGEEEEQGGANPSSSTSSPWVRLARDSNPLNWHSMTFCMFLAARARIIFPNKKYTRR